MISYVTYEVATGLIIQSGTCLDENLTRYERDGISVLIGNGHPDLHYVLDGKIQPYSEAEIELKSNESENFKWQMPERTLLDMRDLQTAKQQVWDRIKADRQQAECANFLCNGQIFQADLERIPLAMQSAIESILSSTPFSIDWILANNCTVTLDAPGMIEVGKALNQQVTESNRKSQLLRQKINQASTIAEVEAIHWD
ncbi:DUF4376 domain-containing protein [Sapientia aquatica]|uniref:DUF4376 domain-containing protein n=1 Tax=Sapientia aquatica TaxID=1549640 RepID=A0A4V3AV28_9BURK|nr:DUF4376 domain-containing protein [Sapientia aquatica]TDK68046.1 DUF4376 domain-containing protein [Sapientia aquatica]